MNIKDIFLIVGSLLILGALYISGSSLEYEAREAFQEKREVVDSIVSSARDIVTPPPLRHIVREGVASNLSVQGILDETNRHRNTFGKESLTLNAKLSVAATAKAQDMLLKGYFDHVSPDGREVSDIIEEAGYEYIVVGENLAMGTFESDEALVKAWMESPGHRENILKEDFTEIGVGFVYGDMDGVYVALAVQEFGRPISDCAQVDETLRGKIEEQQIILEDKENKLIAMLEDIEGMDRRGSLYREKQEEYNDEVSVYNSILKELKILISEYNIQVDTFNECLK